MTVTSSFVLCFLFWKENSSVIESVWSFPPDVFVLLYYSEMHVSHYF